MPTYVQYREFCVQLIGGSVVNSWKRRRAVYSYCSMDCGVVYRDGTRSIEAMQQSIKCFITSCFCKR
jgi:hypothetical protein